MKTFTVHACDEFTNPHLAIQDMDASGRGDIAISIGGRFFTVERAELDRLQRAGAPVATWYDVDGRLVCVPAN
jgi:hypothetical protein